MSRTQVSQLYWPIGRDVLGFMAKATGLVMAFVTSVSIA